MAAAAEAEAAAAASRSVVVTNGVPCGAAPAAWPRPVSPPRCAAAAWPSSSARMARAEMRLVTLLPSWIGSLADKHNTC